MAKKKIETGKQVVGIPLKWHISDNIITRFASNIIVQTIENEFKISFFEIKPEILLQPFAPPPKEIQAECVASVIITPGTLPRFIGALQAQLDLYNSRNKPDK